MVLNQTHSNLADHWQKYHFSMERRAEQGHLVHISKLRCLRSKWWHTKNPFPFQAEACDTCNLVQPPKLLRVGPLGDRVPGGHGLWEFFPALIYQQIIPLLWQRSKGNGARFISIIKSNRKSNLLKPFTVSLMVELCLINYMTSWQWWEYTYASYHSVLMTFSHLFNNLAINISPWN